MKSQRLAVVSVDDRLLHVRINSALKLEEYPPLFAEIRQLAAGHNLKLILVDARSFKKKISAVQRLQVAVALVEQFLGYRVAGVISAEAFDPHLLTETMARNRGGNVKMTTSIPEALRWLGVPAKRNEPTVADRALGR